MMQFHSAVLALATVFTVSPAAAQDEEAQKAKRLSPSKQTQPQAPQGEGETRIDVEALIRQLGDDDFRSRRAAEHELRRAGEDARAGLEDAVRNAEDPELRWRAHRALRALDMARMHAPFGGPMGPEDGMRGMLGPMGGAPQFHDMQQQILELQRQMDEMMRGAPGRGLPGMPPGGAPQGLLMPQGLKGVQQGVKVQIEPGKVRVEVEEKNDQGESEKQVYEAETIEEFRDNYPEIAERYFGGGPQWQLWLDGDARMRWGQPKQPRRIRQLRAIPQLPMQPGQPGTELAPQGPRLGVYIAPLQPALRDYLGLEPGVGLLVESVVQDSLAAELGIQAKDIVLSVAGEPVSNPSDVSRALAAVESGVELEVRVNRRGEEVALKAAAPERESEGAGKTLKPVELR